MSGIQSLVGDSDHGSTQILYAKPGGGIRLTVQMTVEVCVMVLRVRVGLTVKLSL